MIQKDIFLSKITNKNIYKTIEEKNVLKAKLNKPFFLNLKLKKKISKRLFNNLKPHFYCKQITFKKKYEKKNKKVYQKCRFYKKKDINEILKISKEKTSLSRFVKDKFFKNFIKFPLRYYWLTNFFAGNRKNILIVCSENNKIKGFLLLYKEKKKLIIDLICTSKKYLNQKVGSSMIAYANNKIMKKSKLNLFAGTQDYNTSALRFYKKNKFKFNSTNYIYHIIEK